MIVKKNIAISESGFIFNPGTGDSFSVNPVGQEILRMLKEDKTDNEISEYMYTNYAIDKDTLEKDFYDFKNMLSHYNLINL